MSFDLNVNIGKGLVSDRKIDTHPKMIHVTVTEHTYTFRGGFISKSRNCRAIDTSKRRQLKL